MTANYYRHAHAVILVYDVCAEDTLYCLSDWIREARHNSRWSDRLIFALWGNKCDAEEHATRDEAVSAFVFKHNIAPELNVKVSAKMNRSVETAFQSLIETVHGSYTHRAEDTVDRDVSRLLFSIDVEDNSNQPKRCCLRSN